jgi:NAD(P)-dependent dehydrogenase (short-subunit alcohol dehydrogenase family)
MSGRTYLVTGATSGIGRALAESFRGEGIRMIALGRSMERLDAIASSLKNEVEVVPVLADLEKPEELKNALEGVLDFPIDGFVHCAGVSCLVDVRKFKLAELERMMAVNFYSFAEILRLLARKKEKGRRLRVVGVSSVASIRGDSKNAAYAATKGALDSFVMSAAQDLASQNVEINTVQPVMVDTRMIDDLKTGYGDGFEDFVRDRQPLGLLDADDVVEQIRFLLFKKGTKVSGTAIYLNSGRC